MAREPVPAWGFGKPGGRGRESGVRLPPEPGHGHSASVATRLAAAAVEEDRVLAPILRHVGFFEAELLALVEEDLAGQAEHEKHGRHGALAAEDPSAKACRLANHVVVGKGPARLDPRTFERPAVRVDQAAPAGRVPRR